MKKVNFTTHGTCSRAIDIEYDPETGRLGAVSFTGGCNGNLKGLGRLVEGMTMAEAASRLEGITCGSKLTSCPDQLACALRGIMEEANK